MNFEMKSRVDVDQIVELILRETDLQTEVIDHLDSEDLVGVLKKRGVPIVYTLEDEEREELLMLLWESISNEGKVFVNQEDRLSSGVFIRTEIEIRQGRTLVQVHIADRDGARCFEVDDETRSMVRKMAFELYTQLAVKQV